MRAALSMAFAALMVVGSPAAASETESGVGETPENGAQAEIAVSKKISGSEQASTRLTSSAGTSPLVTSPDLAGVVVNFGPGPKSAARGAIGKLATNQPGSDRVAVAERRELVDLGVAIEGLRANLATAGNVRIGIGDQQFRFHRDSTYEPQAYMRAREIEKGAGPRQGESSFVPGR